MAKTSFLLLISFFGFQPVQAQLDSLVDVFPLAVGNQWTYQYNMWSMEVPMDVYTIDTGRVVLRVYDCVTYFDSIAWRFQQHRDLVRRQGIWGGPPGPPRQILDTLTIELIERLDGQHQLYRNDPWVAAIPDVFSFSRFHLDTTGVYRYRLVDQTGCITFLSRPPPPPVVNPQSIFTFERSVGEVRYHYNGGPFPGIVYNINHQLVGSVIMEIDEPSMAGGLVQFTLLQNYPNPFNPTTTIGYNLPHEANVSLKLYDVLGREVMALVEMEQQAGVHRATFNAEQLTSGIYFYRFTAGGFIATRKLLFLK